MTPLLEPSIQAVFDRQLYLYRVWSSVGVRRIEVAEAEFLFKRREYLISPNQLHVIHFVANSLRIRRNAAGLFFLKVNSRLPFHSPYRQLLRKSL